MKRKSNRGGARPGAGRKKSAGKQITIRIPESAHATLFGNPERMARAREALAELADAITLEAVENTSE